MPLLDPRYGEDVRAALAAGTLGGLLAGGALAVSGGLLVLERDQQRERATATATAEVVRDGLLDDGTGIVVRWTDGSGRTRTAEVELYDAADARRCEEVQLRYDPGLPSGRVEPVFPVGLDAVQPGEDAGVVAGLGVALALLSLVLWPYRLLLARRSLRRPLRPASLVPMVGSSNGAASTWLLLLPDGARLPERPPLLSDDEVDALDDDELDRLAQDPVWPDGTRWTRCVWTRALDELEPGTAVQVHGEGRRRGVVLLPDGGALLPCGLQRARPPRSTELDLRPVVSRAELSALRRQAVDGDLLALARWTSIVEDVHGPLAARDPLREEWAPPPAPSRWAALLHRLRYVPLLLALPGFGAAGVRGAVTGVVAGVGLTAWAWAAYGGDPES